MAHVEHADASLLSQALNQASNRQSYKRSSMPGAIAPGSRNVSSLVKINIQTLPERPTLKQNPSFDGMVPIEPPRKENYKYAHIKSKLIDIRQRRGRNFTE